MHHSRRHFPQPEDETMTEPTPSDLSAIYNPESPILANPQLLQSAKTAIDAIDRGNLTPETHYKFKERLHQILDISPNKAYTADWLTTKLSSHGLAATYNDILNACSFAKSSGAGRPSRESSEPSTASPANPKKSTAGRSSNFSAAVKSIGLCRVSGDSTSTLHSCHIIAFSSKGEGRKLESYCDLIRAMFGLPAWESLLTNVMNDSTDTNQNINRLDNGIALSPSCHAAWDSMRFVLVVDWSTYDPVTKEFDAEFQWLSEPAIGILNCWKGPIFRTSTGADVYAPIENHAVIPFRRLSPPGLEDGKMREPPVPSAHLLYVRETLTRIAHIMGASGEYDGGYDGDSDVDEFVYCPDSKSHTPEDPTTPTGHNSPPGSGPEQAGKAVNMEPEVAVHMGNWFACISTPELSETTLALDLATPAVCLAPRASQH